MNSRLATDGDNAILTEIKSLQADIAQLKASRQSIGHALVTHGYVTQSTAAFDVSAYSIPANTSHAFTIYFTGDGTQPSPFGYQFSAVYNNGTDSAHRLNDYGINDSSGTNYNWYTQVPTGSLSSPYLAWQLVVNAGASGASVYIKFRVSATCPGTWQAQW